MLSGFTLGGVGLRTSRLGNAEVHLWTVAVARAGGRGSSDTTLRQVLSRYVDADGLPGKVRLIRGAFGKPRLVTNDGEPLQFSASRSGDLCLVGVTRDGSIGVDVEHVQPLPDLEPLARRLLAPAEAEAILGAPEPVRTKWFHQAWTRKEAYAKAVGAGVVLPFASFAVSVDDQPPSILWSERGDAADWSVLSMEPAVGAVAAVVVRRVGPTAPVLTMHRLDDAAWR